MTFVALQHVGIRSFNFFNLTASTERNLSNRKKRRASRGIFLLSNKKATPEYNLVKVRIGYARTNDNEEYLNNDDFYLLCATPF